MYLEPDDEAMLRMLAGAHFSPGSKVILPSGREMGGNEVQALTSFYAADSPIGAYEATGRKLADAPPFTQDLLRMAQDSHNARVGRRPFVRPTPVKRRSALARAFDRLMRR